MRATIEPRAAPEENTEHVRIGQRIAKQSLEADASDGKRSPDEDSKQNARQADAEDNHAVVTGERTGAMKKEADEVLAEAVQRNLDCAEFHGHDNDSEKNESENCCSAEGGE